MYEEVGAGVVIVIVVVVVWLKVVCCGGVMWFWGLWYGSDIVVVGSCWKGNRGLGLEIAVFIEGG